MPDIEQPVGDEQEGEDVRVSTVIHYPVNNELEEVAKLRKVPKSTIIR